MQIRQQKRSYSFAAMLLLITFAADFAAGRPDVRQSPFALELQPPLLQPAEEAFNPTTAGGQKTIDSYGNPIDALRPIDTPDGRKVVSAQGVQFEIPTYASGITEIRRPADDLLPPHIDAIAVGLEPSSSNSDPKPNSFLGTASASSAPAPIPATSLTPPHHDPSPDTTTNAAAAAAVEVEQAHIEPLPQQQEDLPEYLRELQRQDPNIGGPVAWQPSEAGVPLIAYDLLPPHQDQEKKDQEQQEQEPVIITQEQQQPAKRVQGIVDPISHNIRLSLSSGSAALSSADPQPQAQEQHQTQVLPEQQKPQADGPAAHGTNAHVGSTTPSNAAGRFPNRQRGTAHYSTTRSSSTTLRPRTSTTTTATTTTTRAPTTTSTSTARTTHRTTTRTTSTTRAPTTTSTLKTPTTTEDPASFYSLDNAEEYAYTLPTWLQEVTDPDLDVAVTFVVPTDNDQYNHTLASDLEPPYEPFVDLGNIQLTPPPTAAPPAATSSTTPRSTTTSSTPRTTTTTTTTTRKPTTTQTTTTTTTRRPSTKRTTNAPIPTTTHSIPAHPELIQTQNQIKVQPADAAPEDLGRRSTSSTPSSLDVNPFDSATIPAWLRDFDYPDVGPGVPFDPDNFGSQPAASSSSNQSPTSPPRPFTNLPTASSAFPSKVTLPLPGSGTTSFPSAASSSSSSSEEPPLVLIPPAERPDSGLDTGSSSVPGSVPGPLTQPSTNSITPFAARFDPQESSGNGIGSADSLPPLKVEYTKSDEGKVISTPVASIPRKTESPTPATTSSSSTSTIGSGGKYTGGFGAPAGLLRPLAAGTTNQSPGSNSDIYVAGEDNEYSSRVKANKARPTVNPGRYNGGFRAPTGVLSPQAEPRPFQAQASSSSSSGAAPIGGQRRTDSRFGGPPGILVPFDNVQRTGGQ